jgi:hypothetical protein
MRAKQIDRPSFRNFTNKHPRCFLIGAKNVTKGLLEKVSKSYATIFVMLRHRAKAHFYSGATANIFFSFDLLLQPRLYWKTEQATQRTKRRENDFTAMREYK